MKAQADKAIALSKSDPVQFQKIAMGEASAPTGLREGSVYSAAVKIAEAKGDVQAIKDLSRSKLATLASELGQSVKAFDRGDTSTSPVDIIKNLEKERNAKPETVKAKARTVKEEGAKMDTEIKKNITPKTWKDFIDSIKCNY